MKRLSLLIFLSFFMLGCSSQLDTKISKIDKQHTLTGKRDALLKFSSEMGFSADNDRETYLKYGKEDDSFLNRLVLTCKTSEYKDCVQKFYSDETDKKITEKRSQCFSDDSCRKGMVVDDSKKELNSQYYLFVYYDRYNSSEADSEARMVCRAISKNQRAGMPYSQAEVMVRGIDGVDPVMREMLVKIANSCWNLSYYGFSDPMSTLKPIM